jgi:hypothetical protein
MGAPHGRATPRDYFEQLGDAEYMLFGMTPLAATLLMIAASPGCAVCDLDHTAADLAGPDAVDCGSSDGSLAETAWACAVDAFENDQAFTISWSEQGTDSTTTYVLVSNGKKIWKLAQGDYKKSKWSTLDIEGWDCISPMVVTPTDDPKNPEEPSDYAYVGCPELKPDGNHYQVCGDINGGNPVPLEFDP